MARPTGDAYVDSILYGTTSWAPDTLRYYFDNSYDMWTFGAKDAFRAALKSWSDVIALDFQEVLFAGSADLVEYYLNDADMTAIFGSGTLGAHELPVGDNYAGTLEGWYNWQAFGRPTSSGYSAASLLPGGQAMSTMIHEIGHALGLAHPHDNDFETVLMPGVSAEEDLGTYKLNQGVFTVMSYNDGWHVQDPWGSGVNDRGYNAGPGAFDVAAVQFLYGADTSNNTGATTYTLTDKMGWGAIWDTGGNDTIRYSGNENAVINLNSAKLDEGKNAGGFLSYVKGSDNYGGYTIAGDITNALANQGAETGVIIENATGGRGRDIITGNKVDNVLLGNAGNDILRGRAGDDRLESGDGKDEVYGDQGSDTIRGGVGNDLLVGGAGHDTLIGGPGADRLQGISGADNLQGLAGKDRLFGAGGDDTLNGGTWGDLLNGGAGDDILRGEGGSDTFVYREGFDNDRIVDFAPLIDTLQLDSDLWAGPSTLAQAKTYATAVGPDVEFDFGGGDVLRIVGVTLADLTGGPAGNVDII